jgi:hypothetical protein
MRIVARLALMIVVVFVLFVIWATTKYVWDEHP